MFSVPSGIFHTLLYKYVKCHFVLMLALGIFQNPRGITLSKIAGSYPK
jgi:hypothetical protein